MRSLVRIPLDCALSDPSNWHECIQEALSAVISVAFGGLYDLIEDAIKSVIADAVGFVIEAVGTIWIDVPTPKVTSGANYTPNQAVEFMHGVTYELMFAAAVISIVIAGARTALTQRAEPLQELAKSLATVALVAGAGLAFITVLTEASDGIASSFINRAREGQGFGERIAALIKSPLGDLSLPLVILLGVVAIVTSIIQIMLMIVRNGMLILLAGILPLAAAATNTEMGKAWFKKIIGWLAAFVAYKPIAAFIYAAAIKLGGTPVDSSEDLILVLAGVTMMVMAVVALPAMLRFVAPKGS